MIPTTAKLGLVPGWAVLWLFFLVAVGIFARRVVFLIRLVKLGRAENRFDNIPERLKRVLIYVFGQRRLLDEPLVGIPHVLIFYGFLVSSSWAVRISLLVLPPRRPNEISWVFWARWVWRWVEASSPCARNFVNL